MVVETPTDMIARLTGFTWEPWQWLKDNLDDGSIQWRLSPGILLPDGTDGTPSGDKMDLANAALIAAAPDLHRELAAALAREAALREALKPFALLLQPHHDDHKDHHPLFGIGDPLITAGDCRRALAALAVKP